MLGLSGFTHARRGLYVRLKAWKGGQVVWKGVVGLEGKTDSMGVQCVLLVVESVGIGPRAEHLVLERV